MHPTRLLLATTLCGALALPSWAESAAPVQFLTGPNAGAPADIALAYVRANLEILGLTEADLAEIDLRDNYPTKASGMTHLVWRQHFDGIEVYNGDLNVNVARNGAIINVNNLFVPDLAGKVLQRSPAITPERAVQEAASHFGLMQREALLTVEAPGGPMRKVVLSGAGLSDLDIPVQLVYQPNDARTEVTLAWDLSLRLIEKSDWWSVRVDAASGRVISQYNWTSHLGHGDAPQGVPADQYRVYPFPAESPQFTTNQLVTGPADPVASPFGWHDTDGDDAPDFTDTRGNNVFAQEDLDNNNTGGARPTGTGSGPLVFDFAHDPGQQPDVGTNLNASQVSLFYWNNILHDVTYHYGFDEASGNFQQNNYGNGGIAGDPVQADAIDGSGRNNANFATPTDGLDPRMQMFKYAAPVEVVVTSPAGIAGSYASQAASFGPLNDLTGLTDTLVYVNDGVAGVGTPPGTVNDGCEAFTGVTGQIAVMDRGFCDFSVKALNAQNAGAVAVIVVNNVASPPIIAMGEGSVGSSVNIPSQMISLADGNTIKPSIASPGVTVIIRSTLPHRDSDFDAGTIAHEYGHGVSNRLTGGPTTPGCLSGTEQAGEGWSDFWSLVLMSQPTDTSLSARPRGTYTQFQPIDGPGIRVFPYSTDLAVNPLTYGDVATLTAPHAVGTMWATALWELYWEMRIRWGYSPDLYNGDGGNNRMIRLVVDGMKLQGCNPTMVVARNAILLADQNAFAGANQCAIWRAFAKRGLGQNAVAGSINQGDETEDFTIPAGCAAGLFTDGFESGSTSAWNAAVP
jgi:extracellular elastinolytic metalloproteinase